MNNGLLDAYTLPARAVIVVGVLLAAGGTWAYVDWVYDDLRPGRYPLFLFAVPVCLVAAAFVGVGLWMLRLLRIPIMRVTPSNHDDGQSKE